MQFNAFSLVYLLLLVPALVALYAWGFHRRRRALAAFVERAIAPKVMRGAEPRRRWLKAASLIGAATALIVALMQPQWGRGALEQPLVGRDLIVLLDISRSMLAEDAQPSRLAQAKAAARSLVEAVQREGGHRLALLTFAGRTDVQSPLTRDYDLFLKRLDDATSDDVSRQGTAIGDVLQVAARSLGELEPAYTDIILLSDGEDHESLALEAARMLAAQGFSLYTIGFGDPDRAARIPIASGKGDDREVSYLVYHGEEVETVMRRGLLVGLAEMGGGVYLDGAGSAVGARLYAQQIAGKPRHEMAATSGDEMKPRFQLFILLALVLLVAEMVMREPTGEAA
jgi:Ca-activated chloride channel family protein